jgi:hypothetical protein
MQLNPPAVRPVMNATQMVLSMFSLFEKNVENYSIYWANPVRIVKIGWIFPSPLFRETPCHPDPEGREGSDKIFPHRNEKHHLENWSVI